MAGHSKAGLVAQGWWLTNNQQVRQQKHATMLHQPVHLLLEWWQQVLVDVTVPRASHGKPRAHEQGHLQPADKGSINN